MENDMLTCNLSTCKLHININLWHVKINKLHVTGNMNKLLVKIQLCNFVEC